ncbi:hypothetical protein ABSA28_00550 [Candidatus Hepatincolaceae symbiont of Richtersius coronifer]
MKVAEIYADMALNVNQGSFNKAQRQFSNFGKNATQSFTNPIVEGSNKVENAIAFVGKALKGFLVFQAVSTAFDMAIGGIKNMNDELQKGIAITGNFNDLAGALGLSFKQTQQLNIAALLGGMDGAQDLYKPFIKFQEALSAYRKGEQNESTSIIGQTLSPYIGKENDLQLFGRISSALSNLDKDTASNYTKAIFGETNAKQKNFLQNTGYSNLNKAYKEKDLYINEKQATELGSAETKLKINNYEREVKDINELNVEQNLKVSQDSAQIKNDIKEVKEKLNGIYAWLAGEGAKFTTDLRSTGFWVNVAKVTFTPAFFSTFLQLFNKGK